MTLIFNSKKINERAFDYYARLRKVKQYVQQHYSEAISLEKAAAVAGMEAKYFSTVFRRRVGISFSSWLAHVRVSRAIDLMKSANYSVSFVGYTVGFEDLRTFQRTFKRLTGLSPRDFKRLLSSEIGGIRGD